MQVKATVEPKWQRGGMGEGLGAKRRRRRDRWRSLGGGQEQYRVHHPLPDILEDDGHEKTSYWVGQGTLGVRG